MVPRYDLAPPPLFQRGVSHNCLTYFHKGQSETAFEDIEAGKMEDATSFINYLVESGRLSVLSNKTVRGIKGK